MKKQKEKEGYSVKGIAGRSTAKVQKEEGW